ncbi:MAG: hypothetical protein JNJ80_21375 [Gemmatimonadetes bacterium]|nr:hypothetical protein [Gemmatimonadota bacterium]MCC7132408.1 hypothetical protein [Gemmatimonadales bacterium]
MKLRDQHVEALGGCTECQRQPPEKAPPAEPGIGAGAPGKSVVTVDESKAAFIAIELVDAQGLPIPGAECLVTLPDGSKLKTNLDPIGKVRIEGIDPGECVISFPAIDRRDFI